MLIIGAGGFAKEVLEAGLQLDVEFMPAFFDNVTEKRDTKMFGKYRILNDDAEASRYFAEEDNRFLVGIGNPAIRARMFDHFCSLGGIPTSIVSPRAVIGSTENTIGEGSVLLTNVVVESSNTIGKNVILHVSSFVSHDVVIGNHCEISPFASLLGAVEIGERTSLGTGCVVLPKIKIGSDVVVGAGSVVTKDVEDGLMVIGVPARPA